MDKEAISKLIRSPKDYWKIGPVYIWKWLALLLLGVLCAAIILLSGLPLGLFSRGGAGIPTYRYNDPDLQEISGTVRILDGQDVIRYEGEVSAGACTGNGKVYDAAGQLVYEGPLVDGVYEGADAKVYADGFLVYEGEMVQNLYEGQGRRIDPTTGIISEGQFVAGVFEGEGQEFFPDGTLFRSGTFARDLLNGEGQEYSEDGTLLRIGTFSDGLLHGTTLRTLIRQEVIAALRKWEPRIFNIQVTFEQNLQEGALLVNISYEILSTGASAQISVPLNIL